MKNVLITVPYPISVNKIYHNRVIIKDKAKKNRLRGRGLTKEARDYKLLVAWLIKSKLNGSKFGSKSVKVTILDNPSNLRGDSHNGLKIVYDAIELSGLIDNDNQIIAMEIIPGVLKTPPSWTLKIEPYEEERRSTELC